MSQNVYQMYVENGNQAGFWIQRESWGNTIAFVRSVAGQTSGELEGIPPYYGNPPVIVDLWQVSERICEEWDFELSCPGTYSYRRVRHPSWCLEQEDPR